MTVEVTEVAEEDIHLGDFYQLPRDAKMVISITKKNITFYENMLLNMDFPVILKIGK